MINSAPDSEAILHLRLMELAPDLKSHITSKIPVELAGRISPEDVIQDVWIAAFQRFQFFRSDGPDAFNRWLYGIARRRVAELLRNMGTSKRGGGFDTLRGNIDAVGSSDQVFSTLASPDRTPSKEAISSEKNEALQEALGGLPEDRRQVIQMRYLEGRSGEEIAHVLNRTRSSVRRTLMLALRDMRQRLGHPGRFLSDTRSSEKNAP